jgi:chromosome segregation protein
MQLKKMILSGFKSFADKTTINFDQGITCIVGPNGCGKSNIVDAFLWILGELSAKSIRGQTMKDIIFSGTTQRKPLNIAEVSLTLLNSNKLLPIDYEEVTITRRLHRDGESEYFLNNHRVRLKEIHHLLRDSGIGHQSFSIFEQGKIDDVIRYTPIERKFIFEDAVGISRFLHRKEESLRHLSQVENNLERVVDIFKEVEKQVISLKIQAEAAIEFQKQQEQLIHLEMLYTLMEWDRAEKKRVSISLTIDQNQLENDRLNKDIQSLNNQVDQLSSYLSLKNREMEQNEGLIHQFHNKLSIVERDLQSEEERLKEVQKRDLYLKKELTAFHEFSSKNSKLSDQLQLELKEVENKLLIESDNALTPDIKRMEKELIELQNNLQRNQKLYLDSFKKNAALENESKQIEIRIENSQERLKTLEMTIKNRKIENEKKNFRLKEVQDDIEIVCIQIKKDQSQIVVLNQKIVTYTKTLSEIQNKKNSLHQLILEKQARHKVLVKFKENHEGFSDSSKKLLQENSSPTSPLHQKITPLYQMIPHENSAVRKFIAEGGIYPETLVVKSKVDLETVIQRASTLKLTNYSLFCLEYLSQPISTHFSEKFSKHLPILQMIETLKKESPLDPLWSNDGFYIDHRRVIFRYQSNQNHPFFYEEEIAQLESELKLTQDKKIELEADEKKWIDTREIAFKEKAELEKALKNYEKRQWELQGELKRLDEDLAKIEKEGSLFDKEHLQLDLLLKDQKNRSDEISKNLALSKNDLNQLQSMIHEQEKTLSHKTQLLKLKQKERYDQEESRKKLMKNQQDWMHQWDLLKIKNQENSKQMDRVKSEIKESDALMTSLDLKIKENRILLLQFKEESHKHEKTRQDYLAIIQEDKNKQETLKKSLLNLQLQLKKSEQEHHQKNLQMAEASFLRNSLENRFIERFSGSLTDHLSLLKDQPKQPTQKEIEKEILLLKESLKEIGAINMASITELEHHEGRYNDLKIQMTDLEKSKEDIIQIISQLETESRKIFREGYEVIRENFRKNFQILFEGGEADLQLVGSNASFDGGVEIIAKPPGKQMKSLTLLSGGEKCLTALALLFAIFEFKPSPFCILDEIDAPLDDSNVDRFIKMIRHFADRSQFLVITHNKRTMAAAHSLCGVSMEQKGISKLLVLQLAN